MSEARPTCTCKPCPGRGNDGHGLTHCAECCFGSGIEEFNPDCARWDHREQAARQHYSPASETPGQGEGDLRGEVSLRIERHFGHDEGAECGPRCGTSYDGPMPPLDPPHHCAAVEQRTLAEQKVARVEALIAKWEQQKHVMRHDLRAALADPEADRGGTTPKRPPPPPPPYQPGNYSGRVE